MVGDETGSEMDDGPKWAQVYAELRRRILTCTMEPGSVISEVGLARTYGCSPTPVRDAISRLRQEGLIVVDGGRRQIVATLTLKDVSSLAEARALIETGVVRLLLADPTRITDAGLSRLRELAGTGGMEEPSAVIAANRAFHVGLAKLTDNGRIVTFAERVLDDSERIFHIGIGTIPTGDIETIHLAVVDAIAAGDADSAAGFLEREAFGTRERVFDLFFRQRGGSGDIHLSLTPDKESAR